MSNNTVDVSGLVASWPTTSPDLREQFLEDYPQLATIYGLKVDDPYDDSMEIIGDQFADA